MFNLPLLINLIEDSDSDTDDDLIRPALKQRRIRDNSNPLSVSNKKFIQTYRLSKEAFLYVLDEIKSSIIPPRRSTSIPVILKLAATLRLLAEGSHQRGTGQDRQIGFSQPTVSIVLKQIIHAIETKLCPKWITMKMSEKEKTNSKQNFLNKTGIPGVIGCVGGTHVYLIRPRPNGDEHLFLNKNGKYSLNVLIICDYKFRIQYVNARYGGASDDSFIWNISDCRDYLEKEFLSGERSWILGDAGYPLEPFLLTPYRTADHGSAEAKFNQQHAKARNKIERVIGNLKQRFRCLLYARQLHYDPMKASKIVNVCCALHNICIHFNVPYVETQHSNHTQQSPAEVVPDSNAVNLAKEIRDSIKNALI